MATINLSDHKSLTTSPGIYHILNTQNGKFYVGSAKNLRNRVGRHCKGKYSNPHLQNAITKYGKDSFTVRVEIYDTLSSYGELLAIEQKYLDKYFEECWDKTYNISNLAGGGDNISCLSEERKKEIRQKLSEALKGENNPLYGKEHTEETRQKMSVALKGENNPMFGKQFSDEHKQKLSVAMKGENHPLYGKGHTEESKQKMSEAMYRRKILEGNRVITEKFCCYSIFDALRELKIGHVKFHKLFKINEDNGYYTLE